MSNQSTGNTPFEMQPPNTYDSAKKRCEEELASQLQSDDLRKNRSNIAIKPLYGPDDWDSTRYMDDLGFPGQSPTTRGIHASMHRGRPWSPRMVVGLDLPEDYNKRMRELYAVGLSGLFLAPCNSHFRGYDPDSVDRELLGTCGTLVSTTEDMEICLEGIPFDTASISLGDTAPYTLSAMLLNVAKKRSIPWCDLVGTTNQSDYISHYAALHMFYRLDLPGQKRILLDHIEWMNTNVPRWNPISIVGQHMQQAGASPAEAMGLTLSSAIQYANDLIERGHDPDSFLPRFSFFFDVSISFFEEIAKFRAGRRIWHRLTKERFGAHNPRSQRFRFHAQTSGADLTRQQPINNIARVTIQAMAGIFGGLQSLHTDSYDEAIGTPAEQPARIAVATQNILRDEAHLDDVIDPLGGSYYVETLTSQMEEEILAIIQSIDDQGGMFEAVKSGFVQKLIGRSALAYQQKIDAKEQLIVGVNSYQHEGAKDSHLPMVQRLAPERADAYLARLEKFKANRDQQKVDQALDELENAFHSENKNTYEMVVHAIDVGATHGEVCQRSRDAGGYGQPLIVP